MGARAHPGERGVESQERRDLFPRPPPPHHFLPRLSLFTLQAAEGDTLSEDDIRRLAALRRAGATSSGAASPADSGSLLAGVLEEARLIEWPTFGKAAGDTAVVLAIVAASAAVLFAINTALTELSSLFY